MELSSKIDHLIDMLTPPKSAIITGPEVERVIKEIEKARGAGMNQTLLHKMPESLKKALQEQSLRSYALAKMQLDNYSKRIKL